jgi:uracil-DNA glycosylase
LLPFAGQSGARLARLAGVGVSGDDLPENFDLVNLLDKWPGKKGKGDDFNMEEARLKAKSIEEQLKAEEGHRFILLMGRKVERAFGWAGLNYLDANLWHTNWVILFPHPSGVNTWWNEVQNRDDARKCLRWVLNASN